VQRTIFDFGDARIELSTEGDASLIKVLGRYTHELAAEIEKRVVRCRGNIGLVFEDIQRDPRAKSATKFDSRIVGLFKTLRARCQKRGFRFFLCAPPPEITDVLKLIGALEEFDIVDARSLAAAPKPGSSGPGPGKHTSAQEEALEVGRRIFMLNQSLERTECLEKELDSAAECVKKFLPESVPKAPGYDFAFFYKSSEKVGGDFFDFISVDEHTLGVAIGDVSGHGLHSALVMGITKKLISIRARERRCANPGEVLLQVNEDLRGDLNRTTFVTALYGTLDLRTGWFRFARAGHEYPIAFRPGGPQRVVSGKGLALGVGRSEIFAKTLEDVALRLDPGDCLLLVTDGLAECRNEKSALYSRERLLFELAVADPRHSAPELLDGIRRSIVAFANNCPQEDDMTAILIKRLGE
jgi:serine phosphatase RsbU (regulator of sigma subunit)